MFNLKPLPAAMQRALSTVAIATTVAAPSVSYAEDQNPVGAVAEGVGEVIKGVVSIPGKVIEGIFGGKDGEIEEVVITGSRIATDANLTTSSPVTMLKAEELSVRGITRVEDLLNDLPSILGENTANDANGATGTATIDLRGLSSDRTLVLTNGHRMGFGDVFALAPDINQVPGALIERIEVLTGGASSTYGSDAMSGVVNFVMKNDFEGLQIDYQYSGFNHSNGDKSMQAALASRGFDQAPGSVWDGGGHDVNVTTGVNSSDGKGNITAYLGYRQIDAVTQSERDFGACALNGATGPEVCGGSSTLPDGRFTAFDGNGDFIVSGTDFVPRNGLLYNYAPGNHYQRPDERFTAGMFGHYEVNRHFEAYTEFQFMDDRTNAQIAPSGAFFVTSTINCNNPLMSAQQRTTVCDNDRIASIADDPATAANEVTDFIAAQVAGVQDTTLTAAAQAAADATATAAANATIANSLLLNSCNNGNILDAAGNPVPNTACPLYIGRRNVEGGPRNDDIQHTSYRLLFGARGEINDDWNYDAFVNISKTNLTELYNNDLSTTRILNALDAVPDTRAATLGQPVCNSVLNGVDPNCVPWNVFQEGGVTQAQLNYLYIDLFSQGKLKQDQYTAFVSGDLTSMGVVSPMAEDGMQIVLGGEYRDERMEYQPDLGYQSGDGAGQGGPTAAVTGGLDVSEFFVEAQIPLAQNLDWIESLTLDVGYRYSDYSIGKTTDTYKFQGEYTPVSGIKFRGGYSRASRVANIRELFEPNNLGLWSGTDPCAGAAPTQTAAQCANSGVTAAQYGNVPDSPAGQYNQITGGNADLKPESSNSFTVGGVFTPNQVPGLQVSIDYWSITIKDAIDTVESEFIVTQCGLTGDPVFCNLVNRNAGNGNIWIGSSATSPHVVSTNVNIGFFETSGIDIAVAYGMELGNNYGSLDFSMRGTWIEKWNQQLSPAAVVESCEGFYGGTCDRPRPEWKHTLSTTWTTPWDVTLNASWRFLSKVDEFNNPNTTADVKSQNYLDLAAEYTPNWIGFGETTLSIGASNVLDNDPPIQGLFGDTTYGNGNTIPGSYDTLGRYMFFGVSQKF